ncbi:MAG: stringent starvation protein B [Porticoccaceae bacterium]|nr:MAG: stringent starvation protein B [Porticoccaceae bacterium]
MAGVPMTPSRPYLLRALYEWIVDNGLTPHIVVDAERPGVQVPRGYVENGRIVLNIAPRAVEGLRMDRTWVRFRARFGGVAEEVAVPVAAVLGIYARENQRGMMFPPEEAPPEEPPPTGGRPALKVVK